MQELKRRLLGQREMILEAVKRMSTKATPSPSSRDESSVPKPTSVVTSRDSVVEKNAIVVFSPLGEGAVVSATELGSEAAPFGCQQQIDIGK